MTAPPELDDAEPTIADRILERLNLELAEPADLDNGLAVAALAIAYDRLTPPGPTHEELGALELKLADSDAAFSEAARRADAAVDAISVIVDTVLTLGPRTDLLSTGILKPVGDAIEAAARAIGHPATGLQA